MFNIRQESQTRVRQPTDLDNMAPRYATTSGIYTFTSPYLWTIEKNLYYLLRNSVRKDFDEKYNMKPSYMSYDEYGVTSLDKLLMYINNVGCVEEFKLDKVIIPTFSAIIDICQDKYSKNKPIQFIEVDW